MVTINRKRGVGVGLGKRWVYTTHNITKMMWLMPGYGCGSVTYVRECVHVETTGSLSAIPKIPDISKSIRNLSDPGRCERALWKARDANFALQRTAEVGNGKLKAEHSFKSSGVRIEDARVVKITLIVSHDLWPYRPATLNSGENIDYLIYSGLQCSFMHTVIQ